MCFIVPTCFLICYFLTFLFLDGANGFRKDTGEECLYCYSSQLYVLSVGFVFINYVLSLICFYTVFYFHSYTSFLIIFKCFYKRRVFYKYSFGGTFCLEVLCRYVSIMFLVDFLHCCFSKTLFFRI